MTEALRGLTAAVEALGRAFRALSDVVKNAGYLIAQECGYTLRTKPLIHKGRMHRA